MAQHLRYQSSLIADNTLSYTISTADSAGRHNSWRACDIWFGQKICSRCASELGDQSYHHLIPDYTLLSYTIHIAGLVITTYFRQELDKKCFSGMAVSGVWCLVQLAIDGSASYSWFYLVGARILKKITVDSFVAKIYLSQTS